MNPIDDPNATFTSKLYRRGRDDGKREAEQTMVGLLAHQFECKLARKLTDPEREMLRQRLDTLGPNRLGEVVLDLDGAALAAWIADAMV